MSTLATRQYTKESCEGDYEMGGSKAYLLNAFFHTDVDIFQKELNGVLKKCISYHDYYENFYHGILTGILSGTDEYIVKSNRGSGNGRSYLFAKPVSVFDRAFIIEIKIAKTPGELDRMADEALEQIIDKRYDDELRADGYSNITHYGISFFGKDCLVKVE